MSGHRVLKEGYLTKLGDTCSCSSTTLIHSAGEKVKSWKKRYFVLRHDTNQLLFDYYKNKFGELLGTYCWRGCMGVVFLSEQRSSCVWLAWLTCLQAHSPWQMSHRFISLSLR